MKCERISPVCYSFCVVWVSRCFAFLVPCRGFGDPLFAFIALTHDGPSSGLHRRGDPSGRPWWLPFEEMRRGCQATGDHQRRAAALTSTSWVLHCSCAFRELPAGFCVFSRLSWCASHQRCLTLHRFLLWNTSHLR